MSDNLDSAPVERREGTITQNIARDTSVSLSIADESLLYTDQRIYQYGQFGPYNQTLFLGCSIVNFNVNLGWGAEASSLSVSLVEDDSPHWLSPPFIANNNTIIGQNNLAINQPLNDINSRQTFDATNGVPIPDTRTDTSKPIYPVEGFSGPDARIGQDLHRNILLKEQEKNRVNTEENLLLNLPAVNPRRPDFGKVYYEIKTDGTYSKQYWTGKDPGFVGESYDILGTTVRFIYHDFEFVGVVTSWKNNGSSGGKNLYTVEIKSLSTLLKNTQLIISYYPGTIFSVVSPTDVPQPFSEISNFGFPSNNIGNRLNTLNSIDALNSNFSSGNFTGTIAAGNTPNVFNIYGYLESLKGWGKHDIDEQGTIVRDILVAMDDLINKSEPLTTPGDDEENPPPPQDQTKLIDPRFSPYGRIISKAPAIIKENALYKSPPLDANGNPRPITIQFLKDKYTIVSPQSESFKALKEEDIAQTELQSGSATIARQVLVPPDYTNNLSGNINLTLNKMGLVPTFISSDGVIRQQFTLDFSSLPIVPSGFRISGPVVSILDLVNHVCEATNHDYFVDFIPTGNPIGRNTIKIRTISRQKQPPNNYLVELIKDTENQNILTSYDYGLEFNDEATLRSMYIGAKQKRLLQLTSNFLSRKNNSLLFDPKAGVRLTHDTQNIFNALRAPNHLSIRNSGYTYYSSLNNIPGTLGSGTGSIVYDGPTIYSSGDTTNLWNYGGERDQNVGRGNYHKTIRFFNNSELDDYKNTSGDVFKDTAKAIFSVPDTQTQGDIIDVGTPQPEGAEALQDNYPLWDDFICPYFGLGIDGTARHVSFDTKMQQLQVLCNVADIQNILGFALTKALKISYNTEQQTDPGGTPVPDPTPPTTSSVTSYPDNEFKGISDLNDPQNVSKQMCANLDGPSSTINTFHTKWNVTSREYADGEEKFLLLENEIRAAIAGFDSWIYYTFNKNFTTDLGVLLRYALVSQTGLIVSEQANDDYSKTVNNGEPIVSMVFHGPDPHLIGDNVAESPNSSASMMNDRVSEMLQKVHGYVKNIGDTYYGKQFMVKIPGITISRDKPLTSVRDFDIIHSGNTIPIEQYNGQGKLYPNYKPATDGAWEEVGNVIDDTIIIGSITGDFFTTDDGRFGPILGYNASYEYLNDTIPDVTLTKPTKPDPEASPTTTPPIKFVSLNNSPSNYESVNLSDNTKSPGFKNVNEISQATIDTIPIGEDATLPSKNPPTLAMILALSSQPATGTDITPSGWYPSLITSMGNNEYLFYPYNFPGYGNISELWQFTFSDAVFMGLSAYGSGVPTSTTNLEEHLQYKLYAKGSIEDNFVFIRPYNASTGYREPRAIINISSPVECNPVHLASKYVHHCLMLDSTIFKLVRGGTAPNSVKSVRSIQWRKNLSDNCTGTVIGGLFPYSGGFGLSTNVITNATDHFLDALNAVDKDANKAVTMPIAPKAAMPGFAAVPVESQAAVYGPWLNYPWLVRKEIFTNSDIRDNNSYLNDSIQNLVGGLKVNIVEELAPWKFGGMKNLDMEAIARVENDSNYQIQQEYGTINFPGAPIYRIGDFVDKVSSLNSGPIINSIRTNIGEGGISTEYSLRTFTRRFGLFNKENAQRAAQVSSERLARRKAIALQAAEVSNRIISNAKGQTLNDAPKRNFTNPPLPESWRSSSELLVGHNELNIRLPLLSRKNPEDQKDAVNNIDQIIKYNSKWPYNPIWASGRPDGSGYNVLDYPKIFSNTQLMDNREATSILETSYENTSFMSLDGLLSPISFYPTENARTYHITKYPRKSCRYCYGQGKIVYSYGLSGLNNLLDAQSSSDFIPQSATNGPQAYVEQFISCPFCEPESSKAAVLLTTSKRGKANPPFIVTTGVDTIRANPEEINGTRVYKSVGTVINYSTLNPAILSYGEFSAFQNRQSGDYTSNSIRMLGIGTIPPNKASDSLNQMYTSDNRLYKSNLEYDQLYLDKVSELHNIPLEKRTANITQLLAAVPPSPKPFRNNARFFGLRGPLMVHGWGYDTEGYPVPNASGELQYFGNNAVSATGVDDPNNISYVYKNQKFMLLDGSGRDINGFTVDDLKNAGFTIVTNPTGQGQGYYTAPYKEPTFARGWAQIPSTWPVGPVDLRWDETARVWTAPSTYKNVYVLLEEDLNNKNIARGEIIDNGIDINNTILALGYRKTVFVKDNMGIYSAPRSSIIYCSYDQDGGFYEPISQSTFITSGTILSSNTANLYKLFYRQVSSLGNNTTTNNTPNFYVGKFMNPLDFSISPGDRGLFLYTKDGWVIQSVRGA